MRILDIALQKHLIFTFPSLLRSISLSVTARAVLEFYSKKIILNYLPLVQKCAKSVFLTKNFRQ